MESAGLDTVEELLDWHQVMVLVNNLAEEKDQLRAQVQELLQEKDVTENELNHAKEQRRLLEQQCRDFERMLQDQADERQSLCEKLEGENGRCQILEKEIKFLKSKVAAISVNTQLEMHTRVKQQIIELERELKKKEIDHTTTQQQLLELSDRMAETEVHRNKFRSLRLSLMKAEKKLENVEWERKREVDERMLLEEREKKLEERNTELASKLEETLLVLEKRQKELTSTQKSQNAASLAENLAGLTACTDSEDDLHGDSEVLSGSGKSNDSIGKVDEMLPGNIGNVGEMILSKKSHQEESPLYECKVCNQFLVAFQQRCAFTTKRILRKHQGTKQHRDNVKRLKIGLRPGTPLASLDKRRRRRKNSQPNLSDRTMERKPSNRRRKKSVSSVKKSTRNSKATGQIGNNVAELSLHQIRKFQNLLNALKDR